MFRDTSVICVRFGNAIPCATVRGRDREKRDLWVKTAVVVDVSDGFI